MIDIVIVNWNSGKLLSKCVRSVNEHDLGLVRSIIIVDNGSIDGSLENLDKTDLPIYILRNEENYGFGTACNQGAAIATAEFILFLNPDTMIFEGSLSAPHNFMTATKNNDIGICGIRMVGKDDDTLRHCSRFPTPASFLVRALGLSSVKVFTPLDTYMREWDHLSTRSVPQVIGAYFFVRRFLFEELEGFDPRFFVYFEEVDFSYRALAAGWKTMYLADAKVYHACGGTSRNVKAQRLFYSLRSRLIYGQKHFSPLGVVTLYLITLCIEPLTRLAHALVSGCFQNVRNTLRAYGLLIRRLPQILKIRSGSKKPTKLLSRNDNN